MYRRTSIGILLIALTTLMVELVLTRLFDALLNPNMAYLVITNALFAFGLAGIYGTLYPLKENTDIFKRLSKIAIMFSIAVMLIRPLINLFPIDPNKLVSEPIVQLVSFLGTYLSLVIPFFFAGLIFMYVFSYFSSKIQQLYFWDLLGAGVGCIILIPFLPLIGPGGLLIIASAFALISAALFSPNKKITTICSIASIILISLPFFNMPNYFEFDLHLSKRGLKEAYGTKYHEFSRWDPVSKIDVVHQDPQPQNYRAARKHIAYDGGSQSSILFPLKFTPEVLRQKILNKEELITNHFWSWSVLASHYLKQDQNSEVLIIGSAGGQETKAALTFGAKHVDSIELVGTVVELTKYKYADYIGNLFNYPNVTVKKDEGRSFLRASKKQYDIIQIFSNHTSSSIAQGTGAMATTYLQTSDAYREYFSKLTKTGVLHINHHIYPKMITTAALAWKELGRSNFSSHVLVIQKSNISDRLPTLLIKMTPWTDSEVNKVFSLANGQPYKYKVVENPLNRATSYLSEEFYSGSISDELADKMNYRVQASTDDKPYFNFLRKNNDKLKISDETYQNKSTTVILNSMLRKFGIRMDIIQLILTGIASTFFAVLFIVLPLIKSKVGREKWSGKVHVITYFSCLGAGFIIIELVLIQIFMKLIGYPLYTYSTVLFSLLLSAGVGSYYSEKLLDKARLSKFSPFYMIFLLGTIFILTYPSLFEYLIQFTDGVRIFASILIIFPLGFFLGMPFPLGILQLSNYPKGAVAWGWAMNGLFTIVGGLSCALISIILGFKITLIVALGVYVVAFFSYKNIYALNNS